MRDDLSRDSLRQAIAQSLDFLARVPADRVLAEWPRKLTAEELRSVLVEFENLLIRAGKAGSDGDWLKQVAARFEFHPVRGSASDGEPLFTGYYQPVLTARRSETATYRYPLYRVPDGPTPPGEAGDPATLSRREIDLQGELRGKGYEIAWLKDPVDRFFLHIQGSGLLELEEGDRVYVNFAASNGRPYTSIGKVLIESGELEPETLSMQSIRHYLAENPDAMDELFAMNERYVFFTISDHGPLGSLGVPLTPGRSIATDPKIYPRGGLAFIETDVPVLDEENRLISWRRTVRFVLNQDTGAAIRGPRRVDLYFGSGPKAGARAGLMKQPGRLYFLLKKDSQRTASRSDSTRSQ